MAVGCGCCLCIGAQSRQRVAADVELLEGTVACVRKPSKAGIRGAIRLLVGWGAYIICQATPQNQDHVCLLWVKREREGGREREKEPEQRGMQTAHVGVCVCFFTACGTPLQKGVTVVLARQHVHAGGVLVPKVLNIQLAEKKDLRGE